MNKATEIIKYILPYLVTAGNYAKENDFGLIIALDCGIKASDKVDYANSLGIDFIIFITFFV